MSEGEEIIERANLGDLFDWKRIDEKDLFGLEKNTMLLVQKGISLCCHFYDWYNSYIRVDSVEKADVTRIHDCCGKNILELNGRYDKYELYVGTPKSDQNEDPLAEAESILVTYSDALMCSYRSAASFWEHFKTRLADAANEEQVRYAIEQNFYTAEIIRYFSPDKPIVFVTKNNGDHLAF